MHRQPVLKDSRWPTHLPGHIGRGARELGKPGLAVACPCLALGKPARTWGLFPCHGTQSRSNTPLSTTGTATTGLLLWPWSVQTPRGGRCSASSTMARCGENQLHRRSAHPAHEEAWPMVLTVPAPLCEPWAEPDSSAGHRPVPWPPVCSKYAGPRAVVGTRWRLR